MKPPNNFHTIKLYDCPGNLLTYELFNLKYFRNFANLFLFNFFLNFLLSEFSRQKKRFQNYFAEENQLMNIHTSQNIINSSVKGQIKIGPFSKMKIQIILLSRYYFFRIFNQINCIKK